MAIASLICGILGISKTEKNGWSLVETPTTKIGKKDIKFDISTIDSVIAANSSTDLFNKLGV